MLYWQWNREGRSLPVVLCKGLYTPLKGAGESDVTYKLEVSNKLIAIQTKGQQTQNKIDVAFAFASDFCQSDLGQSEREVVFFLLLSFFHVNQTLIGVIDNSKLSWRHRF